MKLTILMPCLNEARTVGSCVSLVLASLKELKLEGEVLVADNGSTDGSQTIAEKIGARVIHVQEKGYGSALRAGIAEANGQYTIMADSDMSYDFSAPNLTRFMKQLDDGADMVMGNRFKGGIAEHAMPWLHKLATPCMTWVFNMFYGTHIGDLNCGMRGFHTEKMRSLTFVSTGMEFASEMLIRAKKAGFVIKEIPTTLAKDGRDTKPHLKSFRDGARHVMVWFKLLFSN